MSDPISPQRPFLLELQSLVPTLPKALRRVADYVLSHPEEVSYMAVTQLAQECGVGDGTVVRFCQELGLKGYGELKLRLVHELALADSRKFSVEDRQSQSNFMTEEAHAVVKVVTDTTSFLSLETLETVADHMQKATSIDLFGVGASQVAIQALNHRLLRLSLPVRAFADSHTQAMAAANLRPGTIAIGVSHSGSTIDTVTCMQLAEKAGATTVAITNQKASPITQHAQHLLLTAAPETPLGSGNPRNVIAQLFVVDVLCALLFNRMGEASRSSINRTANAVVDRLM